MDLEQTASDIGISVETLRKMYRSFLTAAEEDLGKITEAVSNHDAESLQSYAHHIKGAAINLELSEIGRSAGKLESAAKAGDGISIIRLHQELESAYRREAALIRKVLE